MKYKNIDWEITINGETAKKHADELDYIAEELNKGNTSGNFDIDATDYDLCERLQNELEQKLGREIDFNVVDDDLGELEDLLAIARENKDIDVENIILEILHNGFDWEED